VERPLPLTLEELFKGTHKKMKIKRKAFDEVTGKRTTQDKVLEMDIKPGLKKGSKIKFKGVGDQEEGGQQDLHFVVEEVSSIPKTGQGFEKEYANEFCRRNIHSSSATETTSS
jgi:DnaJ family protein B protein 4